MLTAVLFGGMLLLFAIGLPVAVSMGLAAAGALMLIPRVSFEIIVQRMFYGLDNFIILSVPLFLLLGELMESAKITDRLVGFAQVLVGRFRGGLGHVSIVTNMIMAGISGSGSADAAATGVVLVPAMVKTGYPVAYSAALVGAAATIGPIIPPSIIMVIYASIANVSVGRMFLGGIVPGVLMGVALVIVWTMLARKMQVTPQPKNSWAQRRFALVDGLWALMLPVIIIGGLRGGLFTPTEAGVVAAVYSLFVSLFVYREVRLSGLVKLLVDASRTTSTVMFLVAGALVSSYMVTLADLPAQVIELLAPLMHDPRVLMAAVMLLLLAIGIVMDLTPTILVMAPVLMPLATKAGIDPTYFGVMFVLVGTLGLIHPPVCTVLNVVCGVAKISLESATRGIWPFLVAYMLLIALFIVVPGIIILPMAWFS